jgi:hypothetical protein
MSASTPKTVYLLVEAGERTFWNRAGVAFVNRDHSLNLKLDMFPGLTFNIRDAKPSSEEHDEPESPPRKDKGK